MRIVHLEAVFMPSGRVLVRPAGSPDLTGIHQGTLWTAVLTNSADTDAVRRAWHLENPQLRAASVNAPVIKGKP